jgi:glycosyltransferase involved in cell wall biosynthesis
VLSLGFSWGSFITPLYREMKRREPRLEFSVCDYQNASAAGPDPSAREVFSRFLTTPPNRRDLGTLLGLGRALLNGQLARRVGRALLFHGPFSWPPVGAIGTAIKVSRMAAGPLRRASWDLWHFHFCTAHSLRYLDAAPPATPVICSFWGSDLLREAGSENHWVVRRALRRASAITVQSVELREVVLSKYGRALRPKVHCCRFVLPQRLFEEIRRGTTRPEARAHARRRLKLPPDKILVALGHNGDPANQQLAAVAALGQLPDATKRKLLLVFPMTYGHEPGHAAKVAAACAAHGLAARIFDRFLSWEALAALRIGMDLFVHVPESDALSGTVLEALYAGNRVIVGAWLPYGPYRRAGLPLVEVAEIEELATVLPRVMAEPPLPPETLKERRERIAAHFFPAAITPAWLRVYARVLEAPRAVESCRRP